MQRLPEILLLGTGMQAKAYAAALEALSMPFLVFGRDEERTRAFCEKRSWAYASQTLPQTLPRSAIVCVSCEALLPCACLLCERGIEQILLEKPGALDAKSLATLTKYPQTRINLAYNRRFYPSVQELKRRIREDEAITGSFEFSERPSDWQDCRHPCHEKVGIINSLHVIDLFFFLIGPAASCHKMKSGSLPWHSTAAAYCGSGSTKNGALFSYTANYAGAGRWGIEIATRREKLILRPLEELKSMKVNEFRETVIVAPSTHGLKEGLCELVLGFLENSPNLCSLEEAISTMAFAEELLFYKAQDVDCRNQSDTTIEFQK